MAEANAITCAIDHCDREVKTRGWCEKHYMNWYINGSPLSQFEIPLDEYMKRRGWKVTVDGCWEWQGNRSIDGYGIVSNHVYGITREGAHRVMYKLHKGPIPEGLVIRHKCDNPPCVNPEHLEVGTALDNINDMLDRGRGPAWTVRTECRNGHDLIDPANDGLRKANGKIRHYCKKCEAENRARGNAKKRAERAASPAPSPTHCPNGHLYTEDTIYWYKGNRNCRVCRRESRARFTAKRAKLATD